MEHITDPKIREIMNKLNKPGATDVEEKPTEKQGKPEDVAIAPPRTVEDFMKIERLDEWPQRITSENQLELSEERKMLGSVDDIFNNLRDATPIDLKMLDDLEDRLTEFQEKLKKYSDGMVTGKKQKREFQSPLPLSVSRAFMTDLSESFSHQTTTKIDGKESVQEKKGKKREDFTFPGFTSGELTQMPGQLEAPQILYRVTKAQDFKAGFKKFWKKIFQSEASVAIMQDSFWWFFIEHFDKDKKKKIDDQSKLFDRIADSFAALVTSISPEIKDKCFSVYSDCLAQALFTAFVEAFPDSYASFQDDFKKQLVDTVSEWVTGVRLAPGSWQKWPSQRLEVKTQQASRGSSSTEVTRQLLTRQPVSIDSSYSLGLEEFKKMVHRLGDTDSSRLGTGSAYRGLSTRELSKISTGLTAQSTASLGGLELAHSYTQSRQALCGTPKIQTTQSHPVGPSHQLERVMFNINGCSPLISHYMHMRQLRNNKARGRNIRRTEIAKLQPEGQTYKHVIEESMANAAALSQEYQRICQQTDKAILAIKRHAVEDNREMEALKKELYFCKNSMDVKLMSERVLDRKDYGTRMEPGTAEKCENEIRHPSF